MKVAGIDVSTFAIDVVLLDLDTDHAEWHHYGLAGGELINRVRSISLFFPSASAPLWDDVLAIGVERPAGRFGTAQVSTAFGAVLAKLPMRTLVKPWLPAEWRKACGLKGNATKETIAMWAWRKVSAAEGKIGAVGLGTQDACDAFCIAWATRSVLALDPPNEEEGKAA